MTTTSAETPEQKAAYKRAWIAFCALIFGNFMAILDIQIVASSLNELQAGMSASSSEIAGTNQLFNCRRSLPPKPIHCQYTLLLIK